MSRQIPLLAGWLLTALIAARPGLSEPVDRARNWTDASGKYHTVALLTSADAYHVWLRKASGAVQKVPVERLSANDRQFVRAQQRDAAQALPQAAVGAQPLPPSSA